MKKLNFGCGGNLLDGWSNHDMDVDITKPLPFPDNSTDYIFAEHVVEHLDSRDVFNFFSECYRILKKGGVLRVCVPSITRVAAKADDEYLYWLGSSGFGEATLDSAIRNLMVNHGHKTMWSEEILSVALQGAGFDYRYVAIGSSPDRNLCNLEGHWRVIGDHANWVESIAGEGVK
jgi:predicted SAM-dependent methyltransferase